MTRLRSSMSRRQFVALAAAVPGVSAVEAIVRTCLDGRVLAPEDENAFMWETAAEFSGADAPVYVGRSHITDVSFPEGTVEYSPAGYGG